nr:Putative retroelement [Oryza sativa Japonica Group]
MDQAWMYDTRRTHPVFLKEASKFVGQTKDKRDKKDRLPALLVSLGTIPEFGGSGIDDADIDFDLKKMLQHVEPEVLIGTKRGLDNWEVLEKAANDLLYDESEGCDMDYVVLRSVLELLILKTRHRWSNISFNDLMGLSRVMLPKPNLLPTNTYQAKKLICPLSLGIQKIHTGNRVSDKDVVNQDSSVDAKEKISAMVMWYLPVKDRLKQLFSNLQMPVDEMATRGSENRWYDSTSRRCSTVENFDALHPKFAKDPEI